MHSDKKTPFAMKGAKFGDGGRMSGVCHALNGEIVVDGGDVSEHFLLGFEVVLPAFPAGAVVENKISFPRFRRHEFVTVNLNARRRGVNRKAVEHGHNSLQRVEVVGYV